MNSTHPKSGVGISWKGAKLLKDVSTYLPYILTTAAAVLFTFVFHELAHWAAGEVLGNEMRINLNAAFPASGEYAESWHFPYVAAAGPLFTLMQAVVVYLLMRRSKTVMLYPFLLTPLIMRVLALGINFLNPQDEGRLSLMFGLGLLTLPVLMCLVLLILTVKASQRQQYTLKFNSYSIFLIVLFSSMLILLSQS